MVFLLLGVRLVFISVLDVCGICLVFFSVVLDLYIGKFRRLMVKNIILYFYIYELRGNKE